VIGILANDYYLEPIERTFVECSEYVARLRKDHTGAILLSNKAYEFVEIGFRELLRENRLPILGNAYVCHIK
jgi:hypothetical protein